MRIAATGATLLLLLQACSTTESSPTSPFQQPNSLMAGEITRRVEQIPYQHRDELLQNLMWLAQTGEQTVPAVLDGLRHENPKVRSSCAWVLGRLRDRRTIPSLQNALKDGDVGVRLEVSRSLVTMGDLAPAPGLIEGLDSDKKEVRYLCHEALKTATGHDFGYDHLNQNDNELRLSVLRWRQWWGEYSGDTYFAQSYQRTHNLQPQLAAPAGETKPSPNELPVNVDAPNPAQPMPQAQQPMTVQPQQPMTAPGTTPTNGPTNTVNPAMTPNSAAMPNTTNTTNPATMPNATNPAMTPNPATTPNATTTPNPATTPNTATVPTSLPAMPVTKPTTAPATVPVQTSTPANTTAPTTTPANTTGTPVPTKPATNPAPSTKPATGTTPTTAPASRTNG